jgi:hypothetical protein
MRLPWVEGRKTPLNYRLPGALTDLKHAARFEMPCTSHDSLVDQINGGLAI